MSKAIERAKDWLYVHGTQVGRDAEAGVPEAQAILKNYSLWFRAPGDPGAAALTMEAIETYAKLKEDTL